MSKTPAICIFSAAVVAAAHLPGAAAPVPPPAEAFGKLPEIAEVRLSPSGGHCAALRMDGGKPYLAVRDLAKHNEPSRFIELEVSKKLEEKVSAIQWLSDEVIGVVLEFEGDRFGTPTTETRLIALARDLSRGTTIPEPPRGSLFNTQIAHQILDILPEDRDHVLMTLDRTGNGSELSVYKVNVESGAARSVLHGDEFVAGYVVDGQGRVRLRQEIHDKTVRFSVRSSSGSKWKSLWKGKRSDGFEFDPLAFSDDPDVLLVRAPGKRGLAEIFELPVDQGHLGESYFSHPEVDVTGLERDPYTRKIVGARYAVHYPSVHYFDEELGRIQQQIDGALPDTYNAITSYDRAREKFIVFATAPDFPGVYYLYIKQTLQLHPLGKTYQDLDWEALRPVEPVTYDARDGLTIPGYLTRPQGEPPFPMVVMPHGGPVSRDYQAFDFMAQFLASRGYAVLQPNFRGSSGYGVAFRTAGMRQWGLAMQDDLEDGTRVMIERGIADPERICIVGWSYGGYAALMGAVRTPELFTCAAAGAPVTDIPRMLKEDARFKFTTRNQPSIGHYQQDRDTLRDNSPINNVDVIRIPILLLHGDADRSVPYGHSKRMAARLRKQRKPQTFVTLKDGNHHLSLESNRVRFLKELEVFLGQHLGPSG